MIRVKYKLNISQRRFATKLLNSDTPFNDDAVVPKHFSIVDIYAEVVTFEAV